MFSSRKYTPLPTNANQQRRRAGGSLSAWKRWLLVGAGITTVLILAYSVVPSRSDVGYEPTWENEAYTPNLDKVTEVDETDYSTPPFRPTDDDEEEEEDEMRIQPIDEDHMHEGVVDHPPPDDEVGSPHDPHSDEAVGAHDADPDFTEIEHEEQDINESTLGLPQNFEDDPDPSSTMVCVEPLDEHKPLVQYALTIDAGSTGSRIHVYKFHNCGQSPELEYETFKAVNPGLSAYAKDPSAAAASLDALLDEAERVVPPSLHSCTPLEVKATAGLRLLGAAESDAILDEVRNRLETKYKFVVGGEKSVEIMDGKDEGVYAWITANYLAKKIGEGTQSPDTLAVMDLGGASTQIVFEPRFPSESDSLAEGEHKYALSFGGKDFVLYQHSYLGYGLMRARRSIHNLVAFTWSFSRSQAEWDDLDEETVVPNPCLVKGSTRRVELDPPGRTKINVTMHGGNGGFEACNRVVQLVMEKDAICEVQPCSFDGVYQPSLLDTFPRGQFLALSYFTDRIKPLLTQKSTLTIKSLSKLAQDVCAGPETWNRRFAGNEDALAELEGRPEYCLDLTFMHALLGLGYELSPERELIVEKKLRGVELGWALGAGLALVQNAKLSCTA